MPPSQRVIFRPLPVKINRKSRAEAMMLTHKSVVLPSGAFNGVITADVPSIRKMLKILEPTTLPMAMSAFFLYAAMTDVANSGSEVPMERIVNPMILSEMPESWAIRTARLLSDRPDPVL